MLAAFQDRPIMFQRLSIAALAVASLLAFGGYRRRRAALSSTMPPEGRGLIGEATSAFEDVTLELIGGGQTPDDRHRLQDAWTRTGN